MHGNDVNSATILVKQQIHIRLLNPTDSTGTGAQHCAPTGRFRLRVPEARHASEGFGMPTSTGHAMASRAIEMRGFANVGRLLDRAHLAAAMVQARGTRHLTDTRGKLRPAAAAVNGLDTMALSRALVAPATAKPTVAALTEAAVI